MDWLLFYQSGIVVTAAIAVYAIFILEDMTDRERVELGVIFLFGLAVWPILLYGVIAMINLTRELNRQED